MYSGHFAPTLIRQTSFVRGECRDTHSNAIDDLFSTSVYPAVEIKVQNPSELQLFSSGCFDSILWNGLGPLELNVVFFYKEMQTNKLNYKYEYGP